MKKSSLLRTAAVAAILLALVVFGLPLFSHLYYGRSQAATLFAWQLEKDEFFSDYSFAEYLNEQRIANSAPYELPEDVEFTVPVSERASGDMQVFVLNEEADRTIVYFAGGSYTDQPRRVHWVFLNALAEDTGAQILVPIYPKLPDGTAETAYPVLMDFYQDMLAGQAEDELIFMGDSAGGGMALSFAMQLRDSRLAGPDKLILICPWLDVTLSNPDIDAYEKKDPALDALQLIHLGLRWSAGLGTTDPVVSPLYGRFDRLGHITLITGTGELLYPDIRLMSQMLTEAGIDHRYLESSGMFHVWPLYIGYGIPETEETYADIAAAVLA